MTAEDRIVERIMSQSTRTGATGLDLVVLGIIRALTVDDLEALLDERRASSDPS